MNNLLSEIRACTICADHLAAGPRPIVTGSPQSKILVVGQAPGRKVHETGIPWDDPSGDQLRKWLDIDKTIFYDETRIALVPMGFCYPGTGKSGDLPPRKECAPQWHQLLLDKMPGIELTLLVGLYAQQYYLEEKAAKNLTETVRNYEAYLPSIIPLPHPSPRNRFWLSKNPWFAENLIPIIKQKVATILA